MTDEKKDAIPVDEECDFECTPEHHHMFCPKWERQEFPYKLAVAEQISSQGEGQLPPMDAVTSVGHPRRRFIQEAQREKWAKQWSKMDEEDCRREHYKHYEWELRGAVNELEQREEQLRTALHTIQEQAKQIKIAQDAIAACPPEKEE